MSIVECEVPAASVLARSVVQAAYFRDSYRAPLVHRQASVVDIFFSIFGHLPWWMKRVLIARNAVAGLCGLDVPTAHAVLNPEIKRQYQVGETIGVWPIFALTSHELVAGRNNKHLDFRLSILREADGGAERVVVSTICTVHNRAGKVYLFFVVPFHRWGVKRLIQRAIDADRL
jgi:hypothetical protein